MNIRPNQATDSALQNLMIFLLHTTFYFVDLSRQNLVALGILLGCDYLPQGVKGVGEKKAMELVVNVAHENLIDR